MSGDEFRVDVPKSVSDPDDLLEFLRELAEKHNALVTDLQRVDGNVNGMYPRLGQLTADIEAVTGRMDEVADRAEGVADEVEVMHSTIPDQSQEKIEKVEAILDYATEATTRAGRAGVAIRTGEVQAAADVSRSYALRLMDEIGYTFDWASVNNPGGPKPKQLRIRTDVPAADLVADVRQEFGNAKA